MLGHTWDCCKPKTAPSLRRPGLGRALSVWAGRTSLPSAEALTSPFGVFAPLQVVTRSSSGSWYLAGRVVLGTPCSNRPLPRPAHV